MTRSTLALHFNLVQDVSVLRPVAMLAAGMGQACIFLVSPDFCRLDVKGGWRAEIDRLAADIAAPVVVYETPFDAIRALDGHSGLCIAGSESDVRAHLGSHALFRALPANWLKVTLQHGYECVGFLHNARHTAAMGRSITFAADVIVGWFEPSRLLDIAPSERSKLYVAGPPMMIEPVVRADRDPATTPEPPLGIICENTHSVRFASNTMRQSFLDQVDRFARRFHAAGGGVDLRPHPAGQFLTKSGFALPPGMNSREEPIYALDLTRYAFAVSAPSTVLFDFMLADVPVALWGAQSLATGNYQGLLAVEGPDELWDFAGAALAARDTLLAVQRRFLADLAMPSDVKARYSSLISLAGT
jgi:hypothetical protein